MRIASLRRLVPPIALDAYRRLRPTPPRFAGVYGSADEVPDESPFASDDWLAAQERRIQQLTAGATPGGWPPDHALPPAQTPTTLLVNLLSEASVCRVLDFAGGSGAIYFLTHPYLSRPERVAWDVVDDDRMAALGRRFRREEHRLRFLKALPTDDARYEILHVNTSLQYLSDPVAVLGRLLVYRPRYVILTRLLAGEVATWFTAENLRGRRTPCAILDARALIAFFAERGWRLVFRQPALDEPLPARRWNADVPEPLRIASSLHLVFAEERAPDRLSP